MFVFMIVFFIFFNVFQKYSRHMKRPAVNCLMDQFTSHQAYLLRIGATYLMPDSWTGRLIQESAGSGER